MASWLTKGPQLPPGVMIGLSGGAEQSWARHRRMTEMRQMLQSKEESEMTKEDQVRAEVAYRAALLAQEAALAAAGEARRASREAHKALHDADLYLAVKRAELKRIMNVMALR